MPISGCTGGKEGRKKKGAFSQVKYRGGGRKGRKISQNWKKGRQKKRRGKKK